MNGRYIGIDLGTTNSVAAVFLEIEGRRPELKVVGISQPGRGGRFIRQESIPSVVYFEEPGRAIVGELAREKAPDVPHRACKSIKSKMGRSFVMDVDDTVQTPVTISAHILRAIREALCQYLNTEVREAVITVPASFTTAQREDTINAARMAGFNMTEGTLIDEPTAALLDFLHGEGAFHPDDRLLDFAVPRNLLVFDLGGGTLDISIIKVVNSAHQEHYLDAEVLGHSRYTNLGGDDFDLSLAAHLAWQYEREKGVTISSLPPENRREIVHRLLRRAEEVKMRLVTEEETMRFSGASPRELAQVSVAVIIPELAFRTEISMEVYERVVAHLLDPALNYHKNVLQPVDDALKQAGIGPGDIDQVFMVGGMSRLPCVRKTLGKYFPGKELHPLNFDHAVARGAAIHHRHLCRGMKDINFKDRLSEGVYILREKEKSGSWERGFAELIPGDAVPGSKGISERNFCLAGDDQSEIRIVLYRGMHEEDPYMTPLASVKFDLKKRYPKGTRVGIRWSLDQNKKIRIEGWLKDYPEEEPFVLEAEGNYLTEEELEEMISLCLCSVNERRD